MRQLLLLRHAKSSWDEPAPLDEARADRAHPERAHLDRAQPDHARPDHARPLNAHGRSTAATLRHVLRDAGLIPDVILVSSARRTRQTLDALSPWDETPIIEMMDKLYLADPQQILRIVGGVTETVRSLMVVGHNPGLHDLAMQLCGAHALSSNGHMTRRLSEGFPTGGLAEFAVTQSWRELAASGDGGARLVRFIRPADTPD